MKEYKVARYKLSFSNNDEKIELFLNQHASSGWTLKKANANFTYYIFEREKNR